MVDVDISKELQIKNKTKKFRSSTTFAELMAYSPVEAAQYAIDCWLKTEIMWVPAEEFVKNNWVIKETEKKEEVVANIETEEPIITPENEDSVELTKEDIQELLKANNIAFHHATGIAKLIELAKQNNLLQ